MRTVITVLLLFIVAACDPAPEPGSETSFTGSTMGTTFTVKVIDLPDSIPADTIKQGLSDVLKDVNDKMSLWVKDSELVRFNQSVSTDWQPVSASLMAVAEAAQAISKETDGQFDVTLEPLIKLWGFSTKNMTRESPSDGEIAQALGAIGYEKIQLSHNPPAMRKTAPALSVNLSAIAKGFGIDELARYLESHGLQNYMVEIGGDLRVKGLNAQRQPWKIAIEKPDAKSRAIHSVLSVQSTGMATSGDYRNYFEKDGERFSHIINAKTGRPITHKLASVTVLSETAMAADGWATALLAMGDKSGMVLAEKLGIAAFFLVRSEGGFVEKRSSHFAAYEKSVK